MQEALDEARQRTWLLVSGLSDHDLRTPATSYLSPPVWDLGHMANFEELWLVQRLAERRELHDGYNDIYDAFAHPRPERPSLRLLDRAGARRYMDEVRAIVGEVLTRRDELTCDPRLLHGLFAHWMLVMHEHQHQETLLQTIQMRGAEGRYEIPAPVRRLPEPRSPGPAKTNEMEWCPVPVGRTTQGTALGPAVYDNEAPAHEVDVAAFEMARHPVTCGQYHEFLLDDGYEQSKWWSTRGRTWLNEETHHAPLYWHPADVPGSWERRGPGCRVPVMDWPDVILSHVTYWEAEAFAAWAADRPGTEGARLPRETEWEKACRWDPATGSVVGRNPWGDAPATTGDDGPARANVDQLAFAPSRAGAYPAGASASGCEHLIGDVWEWCSDGFEPYPGFEAFPYREYSDVFFGGDYRILRGGSWATRAGCATGTFRNWDHPYRRQIFSGIRLARDA